jgi:hypothetical protein
MLWYLHRYLIHEVHLNIRQECVPLHNILTDVDESAGGSLAEHLGLVGQRHLHNAGDVS